jgi:crotonobetainyl-CoA:carnitine CoA-transferase CaiB-like acyl-CoA transferase
MMAATTLGDIRVAAFTHFAAGPIAVQYLGALGADVVKIENPARDVNRYAVRHPDGLLQGISPYFLVTNRNQRNICLDLKSSAGLDVARKLIAASDVVVENYRPGVMERLGLGYEKAKKLNPKIIYASISAYDAEGPSKDLPGQDLLIQALSGLASLTGRGDAPPIPVGAYVIDGFTAMQAVTGILAALRHRDATGEGQLVRADMMSSALYLMAQEASYVLNVDPDPKRSRAGIAHVNQSAPYGVYTVKDGAIVISAFGGVPMVKKLVAMLGVPGLPDDSITEQTLRLDRDAITDKIATHLAKMTRAEAIARIEPSGAWTVAVRSLAEALADPAVAHSGIVKEVDTPYGGAYRVIAEPLKMERTPLVCERPAAALGEHTREVLQALGYSEAAVGEILRGGAAREWREAAE